MRIWVTRTQPGAEATAARLRAMGHEPIVQPVLQVRPIANAAVDVAGAAAIAFSSRNAVDAFAALSPARDLPVFVTGEGTARAALAAGFTQVNSAGGDVTDLAELIRRARIAGTVIWPAPMEPAADLAALLAPGEILVRRIAIYETVANHGAPPAGFDGVLIHSPKAAKVLAMQLANADVRQSALFAISQAAAEPLKGLPFAQVRIAARPDESSLLALV